MYAMSMILQGNTLRRVLLLRILEKENQNNHKNTLRMVEEEKALLLWKEVRLFFFLE